MTCIKTQNLSSVSQPTGFTLVELIVVILLIGILSATIAPRFFGVSSYEDRKAVDETLVALRHAQQMAMNRGGGIRFTLTANDFTIDISDGTSLRSPEGVTPYSKQFPSGVKSTTPLSFIYDGLGKPNPNTDYALSIGSKQIQVEAETGYAHQL